LKEKGTDNLNEIPDEHGEQKKQYIENNELVKYFNNFKQINLDEINKLSQEMHFTLKQFLYEDYLFANQIVEILKFTEYKAAPNKVTEKLDKLNDLGLIQKTHPCTRLPETNHKRKYYKLTSIGLFYILKEIEQSDVWKHILYSSNIKIFKTYRNDLLFQIFIYKLIDIELLSRITDEIILWEIIKYLKQICQEIDKELANFMKFIKDGKIEEPHIKWHYNLKDNKKRWNEFCDRLLKSIIPIPAISGLDSRKPIVNPYITSNRLYFEWNNRKHLIEIDEKNKNAKLLIDDNECRKITIKKTRTCFILYRVIYEDKVDFLTSMRSKIDYSVHSLTFDFGLSVLKLYTKRNDYSNVIYGHLLIMQNYNDLIDLAKDEKIKRLIGEISTDFKEHYNQFIRYSK
jgi:hypothetical protein